MQLLRGDRKPLRVGHRGAPLVAHENTLESIEAAAAFGVDLVELDVIALADGTLVLGHSHVEMHSTPPTLDEALAFIGARDLGVQLDLKRRGYEAQVAEAVRRRGLVDRCFASSTSLASLAALARADPGVPRSFTYPDDRLGLTGRPLTRPLATPGLAALRRALPLRLPRWLRRVGAAAATLHWTVISPAVIERCHSLGIAVFAWTVNDGQLVQRLDALGADGIITDDPRLFELVGPIATDLT